MRIPNISKISKLREQIQINDPELHKELLDRAGREFNPEELRRAEELLDSSEGLETLEVHRNRMIEESIVVASGRPVLLIEDNKPSIEFLGPESDVWKERVTNALDKLELVVPAVGRIEVQNHPIFSWVGTGWLVAPDVIVTNRHVANAFAMRGRQAGYVFRQGIGGLEILTSIDFLEEFDRANSLEYKIAEVLWIADPGDSDVAFLRVNYSAGQRPPAGVR